MKHTAYSLNGNVTLPVCITHSMMGSVVPKLKTYTDCISVYANRNKKNKNKWSDRIHFCFIFFCQYILTALKHVL